MKTLLRPSVLSSGVSSSGVSPSDQDKPASNLASDLRHDLFSSLVVALVALPLSLGIAIASGAPNAMTGIIACVIGGIVVGVFGGAPMQVSGPAAGLTLVVYTLTAQLGWGVVCAATLGAGLLQLLLGYLRVGKFCLAISPAVVHGMLAGIGVVITLSQIHIVLGGSPQSSPWKNLAELPWQLFNYDKPATILGLCTIVLLGIWTYLPAKFKLIPGSLIAVALSTIAVEVLNLNVDRVHLSGTFFSSLTLPELPSSNMIGAFLLACLTIGLVASTESLLCAVATDRLHKFKRADLNKELVGQGLANVLCGLAGGLPVTGVVVRSSANIKAGARTKLSTILHGFWILLTVLFFVQILEKIPLASLAGLLVYVGVGLVNLHHIRELNRQRESLVYFSTLFLVVFWDLLGGVAFGLVLSAAFLFWKLSRAKIQVEVDGDNWFVRMEGAATFVAVPEIIDALNSIPPRANVNIDLMVDLIDHAALDAIHNWRVIYENAGGSVDIDEFHEQRKEEETKWGRVVVQKVTETVPGKRAVKRLLSGISQFNTASPKKTANILSKLGRHGQAPKILFVGCSDSRLVPTLITNSAPGELFKLRNVGNLIPTDNDASIGATLEFAINVLGIQMIVVCGHSDCGAMKALLDGVADAGSGNLSKWLQNGKAALARYRSGAKEFDPAFGTYCEHDALAQLNAVQQLENLKKYPIVKENEEKGKLELFAMYFDIAGAKTYVFDPLTRVYISGDALAQRFEQR